MENGTRLFAARYFYRKVDSLLSEQKTDGNIYKYSESEFAQKNIDLVHTAAELKWRV